MPKAKRCIILGKIELEDQRRAYSYCLDISQAVMITWDSIRFKLGIPEDSSEDPTKGWDSSGGSQIHGFVGMCHKYNTAKPYNTWRDVSGCKLHKNHRIRCLIKLRTTIKLNKWPGTVGINSMVPWVDNLLKFIVFCYMYAAERYYIKCCFMSKQLPSTVANLSIGSRNKKKKKKSS